MSLVATGIVETLMSQLGSLRLVTLTQEEYDALETKDPNTLYFIKAV